MALKRAHWPAGRVVTLEHVSKVLADNPLGDPTTRPVAVWLPPQYDAGKARGRGKRFPVLYDLVGYTGSGLSHTAWRPFADNIPEQVARLYANSPTWAAVEREVYGSLAIPDAAAHEELDTRPA